MTLNSTALNLEAECDIAKVRYPIKEKHKTEFRCNINNLINKNQELHDQLQSYNGELKMKFKHTTFFIPSITEIFSTHDGTIAEKKKGISGIKEGFHESQHLYENVKKLTKYLKTKSHYESFQSLAKFKSILIVLETYLNNNGDLIKLNKKLWTIQDIFKILLLKTSSKLTPKKDEILFHFTISIQLAYKTVFAVCIKNQRKVVDDEKEINRKLKVNKTVFEEENKFFQNEISTLIERLKKNNEIIYILEFDLYHKKKSKIKIF